MRRLFWIGTLALVFASTTTISTPASAADDSGESQKKKKKKKKKKKGKKKGRSEDAEASDKDSDKDDADADETAKKGDAASKKGQKNGDAASKKGDEGDEGDETEKAPPVEGSMDEMGDDPAESETSEEGQLSKRRRERKEREAREKAEAEGEGEAEEGGEVFRVEGADPETEASSSSADVPKPRKPGKRIDALLDFNLSSGQGFKPGVGEEVGDEGTPYAFVLGGSYDWDERMTLGLRLPVTTGEQDIGGGNGSLATTALGAPTIDFAYRFKPETHPSGIALRASIGIPLGEGLQGSDDVTAGDRRDALYKGALNRTASAGTGYRHLELYQPQRVPVTVGAYWNRGTHPLNLAAGGKLIFAPNAGTEIAGPDVDANNGTFAAKPLAIAAVLEGGGSYTFLGRYSLGADAWFAYRAAEPVEFEPKSATTTASRYTLAFEPKAAANFGMFEPSIGVILPIAGAVAGDIVGFHLRVDVHL